MLKDWILPRSETERQGGDTLEGDAAYAGLGNLKMIGGEGSAVEPVGDAPSKHKELSESPR